MIDVVDVVVRCRNEMPRTWACLSALAVQRSPRARVLFVDDGSTDGSREVARCFGARTTGARTTDGGFRSYLPGRVLNDAMRSTGGEVVAFVNADAVALADDSLARLVGPLLADRTICATYGRQIACVDGSPLTRADHERTFGAVPLRLRVGRFFSMAASAIRREVWEALPFDESLRYSEDVDWITRATALGWRVRYVPIARFEKSREYGLGGQLRRRRGEGAAETRIHHLGRPSPWGELVRPFGGAVLRDARAGFVSPRQLATRAFQATGYYAGRRLGWP